MKFSYTAIALSIASAVTACSAPSEQTVPPAIDDAVKPIASGDLTSPDGTPIGAVKLIADGETVQIVIAASSLPDGQHGFHLHQTGECTGPDFKSAGGHLNPLGKSHGAESPDGSHVGDLPNLTLSGDGPAVQKFAIEGTASQISDWVLDADGTAVVIHAEPDDYITDPSGAAGPRIACAVLTAA
jgi:Cu-Zn family superoxide dismutase